MNLARLQRIHLSRYPSQKVLRFSTATNASPSAKSAEEVLLREEIQAVSSAVLSQTVVEENVRLTEDVIALEATWMPYSEDWMHLLDNITNDANYTKEVAQNYIDESSWKDYVNKFRRNVIKNPLSELKPEDLEKVMSYINKLYGDPRQLVNSPVNLDYLQETKDYIFNIIKPKLYHDLANTMKANEILSAGTDLRLPHEWFPLPRLTKRKIIYHGGPTNSGKTYQAMQRLKQADPEKGGGIYCGPLRLLALEIYEKLNKEGVYCNLYTGQERRSIPGNSHISCTIETVRFTESYDVAVIDEIQMLADRSRGSVWTAALLGINANEIHVCGGLEAAEIVESLCETTGDSFELVQYERLTELNVEEESLKGDYSKVQPGDCVVAFSKLDIFAIQKEIERTTKYKCAIVYGQLPPETRSLQARLFNDPNSGYDILVATDAIGMGLNLNIRRIIFHSVLKAVGNDINTLFISPSHIKQIGGRAGRKSSQFEKGLVTAWQEADLAYVKAVMNWTVPKIKSVGLFPAAEQIQDFYDHCVEVLHPDSAKEDKKKSNNSKNDQKGRLDLRKAEAEFTVIPLSKVVEKFVSLSQIDSRYFVGDYRDLTACSNWLHTIPLSLADRFTFSSAPISLNSAFVMNRLYDWATVYSMNRPVFLDIRINKELPQNVEELTDLIMKNACIDLYLWLSMRFPKNFLEVEKAARLHDGAVKLIADTLAERKLKQAYDLTNGYLTIRRKLKASEKKKNDLITLPPPEYSEEIRQEYLHHYMKIPKHEIYIDVEEQKKKKGGGKRHRIEPILGNLQKTRASTAPSAPTIEEKHLHKPLKIISESFLDRIPPAPSSSSVPASRRPPRHAPKPVGNPITTMEMMKGEESAQLIDEEETKGMDALELATESPATSSDAALEVQKIEELVSE
jgi:ATP-dependent RNA helicase SUPV3L1/SUV3